MVKKCSFVIILELMPLLNSLTCFLMYLKKASLDQRPSNMMVNTGTWAKYIAMAAPLLAEWRPISFAENPKESGPTAVAASLSFLRSSEPEKKVNFPLGSWNLFTVSDGSNPEYPVIRVTMVPQILTGHKMLSPDLCWVIVLFLVSRFCCSKVIETQSDW